MIPEDSLGVIHGLYYKIGRFDRAYYWDDIEWRNSSKSPEYVIEYIKREKERLERLRNKPYWYNLMVLLQRLFNPAIPFTDLQDMNDEI